jgi:hypothetical protein
MFLAAAEERLRLFVPHSGQDEVLGPALQNESSFR